MILFRRSRFHMGDFLDFGWLPGAIDIGADLYVRNIQADIADDNRKRAEAVKAAEEAKRRAAEIAAGGPSGFAQYQTPLIIGAVGLGLIGILIAVLKN